MGLSDNVLKLIQGANTERSRNNVNGQTLQELVNTTISSAIVDVGMRSSSSCSLSASATQKLILSIDGCEIKGDLNIGQSMEVAVNFQCVVKKVQSAASVAAFVNSVKSKMKANSESDSSVDKKFSAQVQRTCNTLVNESVTKAMIEDVFESVLALNVNQAIIIPMKNCKVGGDANLQQNIRAKMTMFVSNNTNQSFSSDTSAMNDLKSLVSSKQKRTEKASVSVMYIMGGIVAAVLVIGIVLFFTKRNENQYRYEPPQYQYASPPPVAPAPLPTQLPAQTAAQTLIARALPPRSRKYNKLYAWNNYHQ